MNDTNDNIQDVFVIDTTAVIDTTDTYKEILSIDELQKFE
jgi:hypothetical protein